jgi:hypothetical protein
MEGVEFDAAWSRRITVRIDGLVVPFMSPDDLIANKRVAGGPQDNADVARLEALDSD